MLTNIALFYPKMTAQKIDIISNNLIFENKI